MKRAVSGFFSLVFSLARPPAGRQNKMAEEGATQQRGRKGKPATAHPQMRIRLLFIVGPPLTHTQHTDRQNIQARTREAGAGALQSSNRLPARLSSASRFSSDLPFPRSPTIHTHTPTHTHIHTQRNRECVRNPETPHTTFFSALERAALFFRRERREQGLAPLPSPPCPRRPQKNAPPFSHTAPPKKSRRVVFLDRHSPGKGLKIVCKLSYNEIGRAHV